MCRETTKISGGEILLENISFNDYSLSGASLESLLSLHLTAVH